MLQLGTKIVNNTKRLYPSISVINGKFYATEVSSKERSTRLLRQPVPELQKTLPKYLETVKPLLNEDELNRTTQIVERFAQKGGVGEKLQELLELRARKLENWLAEWWLRCAYLDFRLPVVLFSSPGIGLTKRNFKNQADYLDYTSKFITTAIDYKVQIDKNEIPQEYLGKSPLDMQQYKKIFGTCRIPGVKGDNIEYHPNSRHIIVACNNHSTFLSISQQFPQTISKITVRKFHKTPLLKYTKPVELDRFPVPDLKKTLKKYVRTVEPLLSKSEWEKTIKIVKDFGAPNGVGEKLQKMLIKHAENKENWLSDWWVRYAYLENRNPVVLFSNPGLILPKKEFHGEKQYTEYAAKIILLACEYKVRIDSNEIPQEYFGKRPLDMQQFNQIFGTCRLPGAKMDCLSLNPKSKHIIIVHNNHFWKLNIWNGQNERIDLDTLKQHLQFIIEQSQDNTDPVGILTTEHRDRWGKYYEELLKDDSNRKSLCGITSSLFLMCLDMETSIPSTDITTKTGYLSLTGGGSASNSGNRWMDKTVQFFISADGCNGLTYEHTPAEGGPIGVMVDHISKNIDKDFDPGSPQSKTECPEQLEFKINSTVKKGIDEAKNNIDKLVDKIDLNVLHFKGYGKEFIKKQKLSPDSYIQMAFQLTFYRIHKEPGATYESAALRMFCHGRTETIRSLSCESLIFCKAMLDPNADSQCKEETLRNAIDAHKKYTIQAINGQGVDRHLLGLKLIAQENGMEIPELYKDKAYTKSSYFRISSSQVPFKGQSVMVYAPAVEDGYAACYNPRADDMLFGIGAFNDHPDTSAKVFSNCLECSLLDMKDVFMAKPKSKL